jgi:hypothetical protein
LFTERITNGFKTHRSKDSDSKQAQHIEANAISRLHCPPNPVCISKTRYNTAGNTVRADMVATRINNRTVCNNFEILIMILFMAIAPALFSHGLPRI